MNEAFNTLEFKNDELLLIDQRLLPSKFEIFVAKTYKDIEFAIRDMVVRGAPAIGATAAYGVYFAYKEFAKNEVEFIKACDFINNARPTAINLKWAIDRMLKVYHENKKSDNIKEILKKEAILIQEEDITTNKMIGENGLSVVPQNATILTHCNAGALATAGWGTALGVIKSAFYANKNIFVYADETRPRQQGARLTAWELTQAKIPSKLIADSVAATLIRDGKIDLVVLGADRIATNGDVCNKIGTFSLSVICKQYGVPFYSAAPLSTIDFTIDDGSQIPIEERDKDEVRFVGETQVAPLDMDVYNPAFDVTPHQNVTAIITEKGVIYPPFKENIAKLKKQFID
ncbi:MAG: S-methyl-5-thioribose-1-phosphate isomerase [Sphaerochaetaceae bacterium]|nr:S-methyl-5-thioribose-1-phosphate isomerase [Sphaerochaetaceae bacterium]